MRFQNVMTTEAEQVNSNSELYSTNVDLKYALEIESKREFWSLNFGEECTLQGRLGEIQWILFFLFFL